MNIRIGLLISRYRIVERLGMGGMAVVYKAYDTRLEREVALKLIRTDEIPPSQYERLMKRFEREAKAQAKFSHSNIVPVFDYGEVDGSPYIVMDFVPGDSMKKRLNNPILYDQAIEWLIPIADALSYAHRRGVIHRDVKPSNILFDDEERPLLTDFGIAKILETDEATLTGTGMGVGTPEYMAPEQWQGKVSEATDQYSLGVVLYELITGKKPYQADTPAAVAILQATEPLAPPSKLVRGVPEAVEKVLYKALARNPVDRYEDMEAFQAALEGLLVEAESQKEVKAKESKRQPQQVTEKVVAVRSEGETREALDTTPLEGIQTADKPTHSKKRGLPMWALWAGIGLAGVVIIAIIIGIAGNMGKDGDGPLAMLASDTPTATITPTLTQTATLTLTPTITITPTPTLGRGSILINEKDGAVMVYVPAGEFLMGSEGGGRAESPEHMVYLDAYWIYKHEVTNEQYRQCIEDGVCSGSLSGYPENDYPAVYISWHEANDYCEWAGGRLPTEAEWEKAARGTDGRTYPWGEEKPTCNLAEFRECSGRMVTVGSVPTGASPYGVMDMVGNVWEWVADWYDADYYGNSPYENPSGPSNGTYPVVRGGSWNTSTPFLQSSCRYWGGPDYSSNDFGFRCLSSPDL